VASTRVIEARSSYRYAVRCYDELVDSAAAGHGLEGSDAGPPRTKSGRDARLAGYPKTPIATPKMSLAAGGGVEPELTAGAGLQREPADARRLNQGGLLKATVART
jgi:hypothetical protein